MTSTQMNSTPSKSDLRVFGFVIVVFFALIGALLYHVAEMPSAARVVWGLGVILVLLYVGLPPSRNPFYRAWMKAVSPIGFVVSHVLLGLIYYGMITPVGLLMRMFGRDRLSRRIDRSASSYWIEHKPSGDTDRYFRQT
jgi:hypothetical protein